ncbi:MAG: DUF5722 domain-containing protein [Planctomycetota bacterium]|jgi:hypothetical protein
MTKNSLLIALITIALSSPFGSKANAGIKIIAATPSKLIVEPEVKVSGSVSLVEFPAYYGCDYETPEPDMSQGWLMGGYNWPTGGKMNFKEGIMKITFFQPAGHDFDPYIFHRTTIPADKVKHLAVRMRVTNAPSSIWQIVRYDLSSISNNFWNGKRLFRIDIPEVTTNPSDYMKTIIEIDWIAITDNPAFDGSSKNKDDFVWDFTPGQVNWKDSPCVVWQGNITEPITIDRFDGSHDRMYSKFRLVDANEKPVGNMHYVTDLSKIGSRDFKIPWPKSIKGLSGIIDVDDAIKTGIKYAEYGMAISHLIDWGNPNPTVTWEVEGEKIPINMDIVHGFDTALKKMTEAGINITVGVINKMPTVNSGSPLIHPTTDTESGAHYGAFNVVQWQGLRCYRAAIEFLADRYTRADGKYGLISGIIVGNEVPNHWSWYNMGRANGLKMAREYTIALRIADLAVRRFHKDLRVYASLDHWWTIKGLKRHPHTKKQYHALKRIPANKLLSGIDSLCHKEGDFPWNVTFHPYPEILGEPRFWRDKMTTMRFDTPMITFKNLEILPAFLRQKKYLYQGQPRHIILNEQGFQTLSSPDGEKIQAACYAYAFHKLRHMPEIEAFMYYRQSDGRGEGNLRLGLWTRKEGTEHALGKKKLIYDVFCNADTPNWQKRFNPYLSVIGIKSWDEALPHPQKVSHRKSRQ